MHSSSSRFSVTLPSHSRAYLCPAYNREVKDRLTEKEKIEHREALKAADKERLRRRLIGWPLVIGAGLICFVISAFARAGLSEVFGEDSVVATLGGLFFARKLTA